jgi:hypothetical protein
MKKGNSIFKRFIDWLGTFPNAFSENSTKLLALLLCALAGSFTAGVVVPFVLIWDVVTNGFVKTNMTDMGIFLLCLGGFIFGAGGQVKVPKWIRERVNQSNPVNEDTEESYCDEGAEGEQ